MYKRTVLRTAALKRVVGVIASEPSSSLEVLAPQSLDNTSHSAAGANPSRLRKLRPARVLREVRMIP
jgi:hypothetical protein